MADPTATAPAPAADPAAPAPAGDPGAPPAAAPPKAAGSLLADAELLAATGGERPETVPEKFWDPEGKTIRTEALLQSYLHLEKRVGSGDLPPKTPGDYKLDGLAAAWKEERGEDMPLDDARTKAFAEWAHQRGLTQGQFEDGVRYFADAIDEMVAGANEQAKEVAAADLRKTWADDATFKANLAAAKRAFLAYADPADVESGAIDQIGNSPAIIRLLARAAQDMREDRPPGGAAAGLPEAELSAMMKSEAYWNVKHPDHLRVKQKVEAHFRLQFGDSVAA